MAQKMRRRSLVTTTGTRVSANTTNSELTFKQDQRILNQRKRFDALHIEKSRKAARERNLDMNF